MVDTQKIVSLAPHYVVMLVLVFVVVGVLRTVLSEVNLAIEFVVVVGVVFLYPFVVRRLGYAPDAWE